MKNNRGYFITAIGTDSGKTVVSAVLTHLYQADYWKPVQSGKPTDTDTIRRLNSKAVVHPEAYLLDYPASPHDSAKRQGITIDLDRIQPPQTQNLLIAEGAGGLLVPLNDTYDMTALIRRLKLPVIVVVNFYLGSINHTLLSLEYLKQSDLEVEGIIWSGEINAGSQDAIRRRMNFRELFHVSQLETVHEETVLELAEKLKHEIH